MLKKILIGVAALIGVLLVVVMAQPSTYRVERSIQIAAPAETVWAEVANFQQWKAWSHWEKSDPSQKTTITGEPGAVGHMSSWVGEKTGEGKMTVTESSKPNHLGIELEFIEPMASRATNAFHLASKGEVVEVTWTMDGENGFMGKAFGLVMNMDEMIGGAFDEGLGNLKTIAEENAKKQAEAIATAETPAE